VITIKFITPHGVFFYLDLFSIFITSYDISKYIQRCLSRINSMAKVAFYGRFLHTIDGVSFLFAVFSGRLPVPVGVKRMILASSKFL
jgi:hypothetical protein